MAYISERYFKNKWVIFMDNTSRKKAMEHKIAGE